MKCGALLITTLLAVVSSPALAVEMLGQRGGWDIFSVDDHCGMTMEYEGPGSSTLIIFKDQDGRFGLEIGNEHWSAKPEAEYNISLQLNGSAYSGKAMGAEADGKRGFVVPLGKSFGADLAKGSTLFVLKDDKLVDRLSLSGTAVALAAVDRCLATLRARDAAAAREKARYADLPSDPFGPPVKPRPEPKPGDPIPLGRAGEWVTDNDYPTAAMREKRQGLSHFKVAVSAGGLPTQCTIVESSGSADLDQTACALVMRRARFTPGRGPDGQRIAGFYESTVRWSIPEN